MDIKTAAQMLTENLPAIYGFAVRNLYDAGEAAARPGDALPKGLDSFAGVDFNS